MADPGRTFGARLLTPPVISKLPLGLLDFLGIKSGGRYPDTLEQAIRTNWDLERYVTIHDEHSTFDVTTTLNAGSLNFVPYNIVVPQTEMWLVMQAAGFLQTDAGETVTATLAYADTNNFINVIGGPTTLPASTQRHFGVPIVGVPGFLVGPGSIFGWMVDQITTAATVVAQIQVRFVRFRL